MKPRLELEVDHRSTSRVERDVDRETDVEPFVNLSEITEIELLILRRMREFTIGEHRSLFHGTGLRLRRPARLAAGRPHVERSTGRSRRSPTSAR